MEDLRIAGLSKPKIISDEDWEVAYYSDQVGDVGGNDEAFIKALHVLENQIEKLEYDLKEAQNL